MSCRGPLPDQARRRVGRSPHKGTSRLSALFAVTLASTLAPRAARAAVEAAPPLPAPDAADGFGWLVVAWLIAMLGAVAAIGWALSLQQRQRRQAEALNAAAGWRDLLDVWRWRTDGAHRLVELRPPHGASPDDWRIPAELAPLWDHFVLTPEAGRALRAALDAQAPFIDLPACRDGQAFLLRGTPRLDADGQFSHYVGTARATGPARPEADDSLIHALPIPALRLATTRATDGLAPPSVQAGNAAAAQWLGVPESRLSGLPWHEFSRLLPTDARALASPGFRFDQPSTTALSAVLDVRVVPLPNEAGTWLVFHITPDVDTTHVNDQEALGYTVSHDLRAPIRVVEGFTRILKEDYGRQLDRVGNDHLDRVLAAAQRMNSMIDSLLALSQLSTQPLARQPVNLSQLVGYVVDDLRRHAPERDVRVDIAPDLQVHGDPTLLRVALENLVGNAWKYTAKREVARIWFERSEHEGRAAFTVRDNGAGFDMRFADRLFGTFQRLHSASDFPGNGIGLASVRRIVRRHGGDIWAEGSVDQGARFQFWLDGGSTPSGPGPSVAGNAGSKLPLAALPAQAADARAAAARAALNG